MAGSRLHWNRWTRFAVLVAAISLTLFGGHVQDARSMGGDQAQQAGPVFGDDRFGILLNGDPQQLQTLGTSWFLTSLGAVQPPPGTNWVEAISFARNTPIADMVAGEVKRRPGSYWVLGNEPNVKGSAGEMTGAEYAQTFHDAVGVIKAADPTAKIVAPNIINFDFVCIDCPGYPSGHAWMDDFLAAYQSSYGTVPPVDVWGIHTYPLDFAHFPQVNAKLMEDQLVQFRTYLDGIPGLAGAPIWDTEVGTHWGFEGLEWRDVGGGKFKAFPVGAYRNDLVSQYMRDLFTWLSQNGPAMHIDRWFFFANHVDGVENWETVYGGVNLLDGNGPNAKLTVFGQLYRSLAGLPATP